MTNPMPRNHFAPAAHALTRLGLGLALALTLTPPTTHAQEPWPRHLTHWVEADPAPVFAGTAQNTWDHAIRERGWIEPFEGEFWLFYTGYDGTRTSRRRLGIATSSDGITWTRSHQNPLPIPGWVEDASLTRDGNRFLMVAEGDADQARLLTSADGLAWTEQGRLDVRLTSGRPIPPGPYGTPTLLHHNNAWQLFYERGDQGVWLARSRDLRLWINLQDEPVLPRGPDPYDQTAVALNQVFRDGGWFYALYHANAHRPWKDWTTCLARSRDLLHWDKYPGNPIIAGNRSSAVLVRTPAGLTLYTMHPSVVRFLPKPD